MLNPGRPLATLLMTFTVLPVIACTLIARQLDASSISPLATPVVRADEISEASADERILTKIRQWLAGQSASSPADLADALAALSESDGELRYVKALPVEGSQQAGVPAIIAWWGQSDHKPKGGLLAWIEPGSNSWKAPSLPIINVTAPTVDVARLSRADNTYELAFALNPCSYSSMGRCHELFLYRLRKGGWQEVWNSRGVEGWRYSHARLRFAGNGIDTVVLESSSWFLDDPKRDLFHESNAGPHRWFTDIWQRRGDAYVLIESWTRSSTYNTLVEFVYALKSGGNAMAWVADPAVLEIARRLELAALPEGTHIAYIDWSRQLDGPIAVDFRGQRITFYFVKSDDQYLLQAIDSRPVPTPTP